MLNVLDKALIVDMACSLKTQAEDGLLPILTLDEAGDGLTPILIHQMAGGGPVTILE